MKRRDNSPEGRWMRSAVAYDRLAAKAYRAGNSAAFKQYSERSQWLKGMAHRARARKAAAR